MPARGGPSLVDRRSSSCQAATVAATVTTDRRRGNSQERRRDLPLEDFRREEPTGRVPGDVPQTMWSGISGTGSTDTGGGGPAGVACGAGQLSVVGRFLGWGKQAEFGGRHLVQQLLRLRGPRSVLKRPQVDHLPIGSVLDDLAVFLEQANPQQPIVIRRLFLGRDPEPLIVEDQMARRTDSWSLLGSRRAEFIPLLSERIEIRSTTNLPTVGVHPTKIVYAA